MSCGKINDRPRGSMNEEEGTHGKLNAHGATIQMLQEKN